jgi:hypothetical protein
MKDWFNYVATLKILFFGLLVGAALPATFAFGVRFGAAAGAEADAGALNARRGVFTALSYFAYGLVVLAVVVGVLFIARDFIGDKIGLFILGARAK